MPSIMTHAVAASALVSVATHGRRLGARFWVPCAALAMLPDVDVVAYALPIPFTSIWAHRGLSHSFVAAGLVAAVVTLKVRRRVRLPALGLWLCLSLAMASHGLLDTMTVGGRGVALLAPFDATRYSAPWRPLRASPIGLAFFGWRGLRTLEGEILWVWLPSAAVLLAVRLAGRGRSAQQG